MNMPVLLPEMDSAELGSLATRRRVCHHLLVVLQARRVQMPVRRSSTGPPAPILQVSVRTTGRGFVGSHPRYSREASGIPGRRRELSKGQNCRE